MCKVSNPREDAFNKKEDECIFLLTNYLYYNGLESLEYLDVTSLDLVFGIHKGSAHGGYLPLLMVQALILVRISSIWIIIIQGHPLW